MICAINAGMQCSSAAPTATSRPSLEKCRVGLHLLDLIHATCVYDPVFDSEFVSALSYLKLFHSSIALHTVKLTEHFTVLFNRLSNAGRILFS